MSILFALVLTGLICEPQSPPGHDLIFRYNVLILFASTNAVTTHISNILLIIKMYLAHIYNTLNANNDIFRCFEWNSALTLSLD